MEYWWKENKGYVIPVAVGIVVLFVWYAYVLGGIRDQTLGMQRARELAETTLRARMAAGVPSEDVVGRARRDLDRTRKLVDDLTGELSLKVPMEYDAGPKGAGEFFVNQKLDIVKKIQDACSRANIGIPDSVFPEITAPGDELGRELLMRLAMVEKLAMAAVEAGVTKIDAVTPLVGTSVDEGAIGKKGMFVNRLTVRMKVLGPSIAVFKWLHAVQQKNDYLVVDEFKATKESPHEDVFGAEMDASGLVIDPKGSLTEVKE